MISSTPYTNEGLIYTYLGREHGCLQYEMDVFQPTRALHTGEETRDGLFRGAGSYREECMCRQEVITLLRWYAVGTL